MFCLLGSARWQFVWSDADWCAARWYLPSPCKEPRGTQASSNVYSFIKMICECVWSTFSAVLLWFSVCCCQMECSLREELQRRASQALPCGRSCRGGSENVFKCSSCRCLRQGSTCYCIYSEVFYNIIVIICSDLMNEAKYMLLPLFLMKSIYFQLMILRLNLHKYSNKFLIFSPWHV